MNIYPVRFLIALFAFASLYSLYLVFLTHFLPVLGQLSLIEAAVFYTLALRTLAIFFVPRLRRIPSSLKTITYSLEIFVVVAYIFAFLLTGNLGDAAVVSVLFPVWVGSSFYVLLPYFICEFAIGMHKGENISSVLTWGSLVLAESIFVADLAIRTSSLPSSLIILGQSAVEFIIRQPASVTGISSLVVSGATVAFYLSIVTYVASSQVGYNGYRGKFTLALFLVLIGNVLLLGWIAAATNTTTNMFLVLTTPAVALPLILLVGFHERKA